MGIPATDSEIIDLSERQTLSQDEVDDRNQELDRIAIRVEMLQARQHILTSELELGQHIPARTETVELDSVLFLDETVDAFDPDLEPEISKRRSLDFDVPDDEFDRRFAAFAAADVEGDHRARKWLGSA